MVVDSPPATLLDVMSSKWILLSALLAGFGLNIATAQSDSRNCVITRTDGSTTHDVPQFCLSSTLGGNLLGIFPQMKLNFTSIVLRPLPENRQVEIEELDGSPGLAGLANSIANAVSRGRLPYDIIIPYLESSVDNPIASRCDVNKTSGNGGASVGDLANDIVGWWTPIILMTVVGPVLAIIFITVGISFCCCRLCGKCHGKPSMDNKQLKHNRCFKSYIVALISLLLLSLVGLLLTTVPINKVNKIRDFDGIIDDGINSFTRFIRDTEMEINITAERYDEVNPLVECEINNLHISIGGSVIEEFEPAVKSLINSSLVLATQLTVSINALVLVNTTVAQLEAWTQKLQIELDNITMQTMMLNTTCTNLNKSATVCNMIPTTSYAVVMNYSAVDDVSAVLATLQQVGDIKSKALQSNDSFYAIPCDLKDQISNKTRRILNETSHFQQAIASITERFESDILNDILDEDGFIEDVRSHSNDIQDSINGYFVPNYVIIVLVFSMTFVVIIALPILMAIVVLAHIRLGENTGKLRYVTTALFIVIGVLLGLTVILLILSSIAFFFGASILRLCYSIAEDPPYSLPSYELYSKIADNNELWGGYLLGCFLLENSSAPLTVTGILNGCKDNGALYQVASFAQRYEGDLQNLTNISIQSPNLDGLFMDLESEIKFNHDQILTEDVARSLEDFANAGLQGINYTSYIVQTRSMISTLNVSDLVKALKGVRSAANQSFKLADQTNAVIDAVQRVNDTTITKIINLTDTVEAQILMLNNTANQLNATVDDVIRRANQTFDELENSNIVINGSRAVLDRVITYTDSYADWAINILENEVGRCQSLYAIYNNLYVDVCESAVNGMNGFWLAIGWFVLFSIPTIVVAVRLANFLRPMKNMKDSQLNLVELITVETTEVTTGLEDLLWPDYWDEQPIGAGNKKVICHLVTVPPHSQEYEEALLNFKIALPSEACQIIELKRIQNPDVYQQYSIMRAEMQHEVQKGFKVESQLFHGTGKEACEQINHQGFNRAYAEKNTTCYGKGVGFAVSAEYSFQDSHSKLDEDGYKYIYICLVLTGEYTKGKEDMITPPAKNPDQSDSILYHSVVDDEHSPAMFVVFKDYQAYPQYLVKCREM